MPKGIVTKLISGDYTVKCGNESYVCKPRGVFRHQKFSPLVGDICEIDIPTKTIISFDDRKNSLVRPACCNIDKAFLVFSVVEPELNLNLLDRLLAYYEYNDIECIIVFTKVDLLKDFEEFNSIKKYYESIGYKTYISNPESNGVQFADEIKDNVCVVAGQSGVGKSTFINTFGFDIQTNEISYALGRGKHTTRHVELLDICGGMIADTPGFGIVDLDLEIVGLSQMFVEFFKLSSECKYNCCLHINEPKCKVKEAVDNGLILKSRYDNYLLFVDEIKNKKKKY